MYRAALEESPSLELSTMGGVSRPWLHPLPRLPLRARLPPLFVPRCHDPPGIAPLPRPLELPAVTGLALRKLSFDSLLYKVSLGKLLFEPLL